MSLFAPSCWGYELSAQSIRIQSFFSRSIYGGNHASKCVLMSSKQVWGKSCLGAPSRCQHYRMPVFVSWRHRIVKSLHRPGIPWKYTVIQSCLWTCSTLHWLCPRQPCKIVGYHTWVAWWLQWIKAGVVLLRFDHSQNTRSQKYSRNSLFTERG